MNRPLRAAVGSAATGLLVTATAFVMLGPSPTRAAETAPCSGPDVVIQDHRFSAQESCYATSSVQLGPTVTIASGADLALAAPRISLQAPFQIESGATFSAQATAVIPDGNQALLGPLAGAEIAAYRLDDVQNAIETTQALDTRRILELAGRFSLDLIGIPDNDWILVTATGGLDLDADDSGTLDPEPTPNSGTLHALARAADWRAGQQRISALTDIAWRYAADWVGEVSLSAVVERLDAVAEVLLSDDIDGNGQIDLADLRAFDPADASHREALSFRYTDLLQPEGYVDQLHAANPASALEAALEPLFGAYLSFGEPGQLADQVTVRASAFGLGRLSSDRGGLLIDSEQGDAAQQPTIFLTRAGDPLILTATPTPETQILGWEGCDWVADDLSQCRIDLLSDRQVELNFGDIDTILAADFIDLSTAEVQGSGDRLAVTVDALDTELVAAMDTLAAGTYVAGVADSGPFLRRVVAVTAQGNSQWTLETVDASLDEVIAQGTGILQRTLTHDDLAPAPLTRASGLSGPNPVQLLAPSGPDDPVFRLRIAPTGDAGDAVMLRTAANEIAGCTIVTNSDLGSAEATLRCTLDGVTLDLSGELDVEIDVDLAVAFGWGGLSEFKLVPEVTSSPRLGLTVNGALETPTDDSGADQWRIELARLRFSAIKFWVGVPPVMVPVWITPEVPIYLGVNGQVQATLEMGVRYTNIIRAGVHYDDGNWKKIKEFDPQFDLDPPPTLSGVAELKGYVDVSPFFYLYSATGPGFGLEAYLKANATAALAASDCPGQLSYGVDGGIGASFKWDTPAGDTKFGELLNLDQVAFDFEVFDWSKPLYAGELNTCDGFVTPPTLNVTGDDIGTSQSLGETSLLQTQYTLKNVGEQPLPWTLQAQQQDGLITITPSSGELQAAEQTVVSVTVEDTAALPLGTYRNWLQFDNLYSGAPNQSNLGSQERPLVIQVLSPAFPTPTLTGATRIAADAIQADWTFDDPTNLVRGFRLWSTQGDPDQDAWNSHPDVIAASARSATFTGLPTSDVSVAIEAFGEDTDVHQSFSEYRQVAGEGSGGAVSYPLNDTGIDWCANADTNSLECPVAGYPGQDGESGRDVTHNDPSDGHAGFSFTKLDASGNPLAIQNGTWSDSGSEAAGTRWSCVRDNVTGLIWEVKTNDGGLHDKDDRYNWYNTDPATNGGFEGYADDDGAICDGYDRNDPATYCNTQAYVARVNQRALCGARDWRLPSRNELLSIISNDRYGPAIDTDYFPNTVSLEFWSSSPNANGSGSVRNVGFGDGRVGYGDKDADDYVRLVRAGQ